MIDVKETNVSELDMKQINSIIKKEATRIRGIRMPVSHRTSSIDYDYILHEIRNLPINPPANLTVEQLHIWMQGASVMSMAIVELIKGIKEGNCNA